LKNYDLKQYVKKREIKMKRNVLNLLLALFFLALQVPTSSAASFDCAKAGTQVEKLICSTPILGRFDVALSQNFKNIHAADIGALARADLVQTQREWIRQRNTCSNADCIEQMYRKRLDVVCIYRVWSGIHPLCKSSFQIDIDSPHLAQLSDSDRLSERLRIHQEAIAKSQELIAKLKYENGDKYEGSVDKSEIRNGKGEYVFANGNRYVGEFRDGKPHGKGEEISITGSVRKGDWVDGVFVSAVTKIKNDSNINKETLIEKAKQGDAESQYRYGMTFVLGEGDAIKPRIAIEWLIKAAAQGHDPAKKQIASMYDLGIQMSQVPSSITTKD